MKKQQRFLYQPLVSHITLGKKLVYSLISESKWLKKHFQFSMNRISHFLVLIIFEKNIFSIYQ